MEWKTIEGFPNYIISKDGRVKSLSREVKNGRGPYRKPERILKPLINNRGYLYAILYNDEGGKKCYIHRLVASAFLENPFLKPEVNHIDNNPQNNNVENLEWVSHMENSHHAMRQQRALWKPGTREKATASVRESTKKSVIATNVDSGKDELFFESLSDSEKMGFQASCVCNCCKGNRKAHKGYSWRYA